MAGNTKLMGFLPGNAVQLGRWGKTIAVTLTKESMINLRHAVTGLPSKPPEQQHDSSNFRARYDESMGRVFVDVDIPTALFIVAALGDAADGNGPRFGFEASITRTWIHSLKQAVQAHVDFHNTEGEPGGEDPH